MKKRPPVLIVLAVLASLAEGCVSIAPDAKGATAMSRATGTFEVKLAPQEASAEGQQAAVGRMSIDKQFSGDLVGSSKGEMLMVQTAVKGSAGYVALERVTGTLAGRSGTFLLQHTGLMAQGTPSLTVTVIPDSGTADLVGLSGSMNIDLSTGAHLYTFDYTLPAK
jgi:hypothetical protein